MTGSKERPRLTLLVKMPLSHHLESRAHIQGGTMRASPGLLVAIAAGLALSASAAPAQTPSTPEWGITSESSEVVSAWDMQTTDFGTTWQHDGDTQYRYLTSAGSLFAGLHVPHGAALDYIELDACDSSATNQVSGGLLRSAAGATDTLVF